jgi:hypothetical protein
VFEVIPQHKNKKISLTGMAGDLNGAGKYNPRAVKKRVSVRHPL